MESMDEKDSKREKQGPNGEIRVPIEITKIRKWRNLKCIFLFINIAMIIITILLFYYLLGKSEKE